ncbi:hypothetical protein GALMADRAFT_216389 [Galerina marginata CBS 339.88]|uniref:Extracellular membrane protein CFEM domain-containing protein n=1 Tax=Galerina marginata (strain CBS 339.88) TaxID=685588 RepID=A0A067S9F6_GALM3|nr:hypothetical protein GALMADRAFT_216389 [Galerina marginata CBS 339.88]
MHPFTILALLLSLCLEHVAASPHPDPVLGLGYLIPSPVLTALNRRQTTQASPEAQKELQACLTQCETLVEIANCSSTDLQCGCRSDIAQAIPGCQSCLAQQQQLDNAPSPAFTLPTQSAYEQSCAQAGFPVDTTSTAGTGSTTGSTSNSGSTNTGGNNGGVPSGSSGSSSGTTPSGSGNTGTSSNNGGSPSGSSGGTTPSGNDNTGTSGGGLSSGPPGGSSSGTTATGGGSTGSDDGFSSGSTSSGNGDSSGSLGGLSGGKSSGAESLTVGAVATNWGLLFASVIFGSHLMLSC